VKLNEKRYKQPSLIPYKHGDQRKNIGLLAKRSGCYDRIHVVIVGISEYWRIRCFASTGTSQRRAQNHNQQQRRSPLEDSKVDCMPERRIPRQTQVSIDNKQQGRDSSKEKDASTNYTNPKDPSYQELSSFKQRTLSRKMEGYSNSIVGTSCCSQRVTDPNAKQTRLHK